MTDRQAFHNKLLYLGLLVPLIFILWWLGGPESTDATGKPRHGGVLAGMRRDLKLSQSNLGEVDPVSESFKLATLGLRPVAVVLLWEKCNYYKKVEDWSNFEAALKQITYLQPNFIKVWDFQAHNLSFNISAELDDWRDRYYYVVKGLKFLITGTHYNEHDSLLLNRIGFFISQKLGRSDEKALYRKRFAQDKELHEFMNQELDLAAGGGQADPDGQPAEGVAKLARPRDRGQRDSWLVAKEWYRQSEVAADQFLSPIRGESRIIFYSHAPMAQISYARALEEEGRFDDLERIRTAWKDAKADWNALGERVFSAYEGWYFSLGQQEDYEAKAAALRQQLEELVGGNMRATIRSEKMAQLTPAEVAIVNKPDRDRTPEDRQSAAQLEDKVQVFDSEVADRAPAEKLMDARRLAVQAKYLLERAKIIDIFRSHISFANWKLKCDAELTDDFIDARRLCHQARQEQKDSSLTDETKQVFEAGFAKWRIVLDKYPNLFEDATATLDIYEFIQNYDKLLRDRGDKMPDKFVLQDVVDLHEKK